MNAGTPPSDEPDYNLNFHSSVIHELPAEKFDLPGWLRNFSTEDYERCTPRKRRA